MKRRRLWFIGLALALSAAAVGMWAIRRPISFDSEAWRAESGAWFFESARTRMLSDLTANVLKPGLSKTKVEALLGPMVVTFPYKGSSGYDELSSLADSDDIVAVYPCAVGPFGMTHTFLLLVLDSHGSLKGGKVS